MRGLGRCAPRWFSSRMRRPSSRSSYTSPPSLRPRTMAAPRRRRVKPVSTLPWPRPRPPPHPPLRRVSSGSRRASLGYLRRTAWGRACRGVGVRRRLRPRSQRRARSRHGVRSRRARRLGIHVGRGRGMGGSTRASRGKTWCWHPVRALQRGRRLDLWHRVCTLLVHNLYVRVLSRVRVRTYVPSCLKLLCLLPCPCSLSHLSKQLPNPPCRVDHLFLVESPSLSRLSSLPCRNTHLSIHYHRQRALSRAHCP